MAIAFVKSAVGTSTSASVSWGFGSATTAGNLIVGCIAADDYNGTPDSGWTQSAEMEQQGFHGAYIWWRISTGETNPQAYTIASATNSAWLLMEFSGGDASPYDTSQGIFTNTSGGTYTTDTITPSSGQRLLVAMSGISNTVDLSAYTGSWSDSFTLVDYTGNATGTTKDWLSTAYRVVTGDGSTGFSTTITYSGGTESRSALIIAFKESAATQSQATRSMQQFRSRRT